MATERTATDLRLGIPKSNSDRPWAVRTLRSSANFMISKPLGGFGVVVIAIMVAMAAFAPLVSRYDPDESFSKPNPAFREDLYEAALTNPLIKIQYANNPEYFVNGEIGRPLEGPSWEHWLGTDRFSHDLYSRIIYGAQLSLFVGIGASFIAMIAGTFFGVVSGYFGGWVDMLIQRITDALLTFPSLILLLLFVQVVDQPNKYFITLALGIVGISQVIRIVRASVLATREEVYVLAARSVGATNARIMGRHILPNILAPIIVVFTIAIGSYILAEAGLQFIGFGDPTEISWGKMINEGRQSGTARPLMALFCGLAITFAVLGFNLAGDALRDQFDPRLRGR